MNSQNQFQLSQSSILAFLLGVSGVFILFTFQAFNIKPEKFISPLIYQAAKINIQDQIKTRLFKFKNGYLLSSKNSFVPKADIQSGYEDANAYAAIDYNTGNIIVGKNLNKKESIASITKVMSAVVALDLSSPDDLFTVRRRATLQIPTKIGVVEGEKMTVRELLNASLLTSANDAIEVLRDGIDEKYGKGTFVGAMNEKAEFLGLANSHFSSPQGFDSPQNYSTVSDLAILSHYALSNYPTIAEIVKKDYVFLPKNSNHKQFDLYNWNGLIDVYPNTIGLKIGNTDDAKYTTVVLSQRNGKKILAIVLGAPIIQKRDLWASQILDAGYQFAMNLPPLQINEDAYLAKYKTWKYFN